MGERDSLRPVLLDENGKPQGAPSELTWASSAPQVLQVSGPGVIDGLRPGRSTVTAAAPWGKTATADVFVVADLFVSSNRSGEPGIYQLRSGVTDTLRAVLTDSFANIQPALSPDRTRIAFSSDREGSYDLYLTDADGSNLQRLTTDPGREGEPVWTPDGTRLVYTFTRQGGQPQLYVLRPDGHPAQALTGEPGGNHSPSISADGRRIAFVSTETAQAPTIDTTEPNTTRKPNTSWWGLSRYANRNRNTNESCKRGTTSMIGASARAQ
jgi:hypothetical protein